MSTIGPHITPSEAFIGKALALFNAIKAVRAVGWVEQRETKQKP